MHIGLGGAILLVIIIAAVFGGTPAVGRAVSGLGCLAAIVIAGALILIGLAYWDYHLDERHSAPPAGTVESEAERQFWHAHPKLRGDNLWLKNPGRRLIKLVYGEPGTEKDNPWDLRAYAASEADEIIFRLPTGTWYIASSNQLLQSDHVYWECTSS
jgi:hypothetical protein